eukprot:4056171-Pyramimonas_sp.AAC.1
MAFWHDSRSPRRNGQVDPWNWNPENNVLAPGSSNVCLPTRHFHQWTRTVFMGPMREGARRE